MAAASIQVFSPGSGYGVDASVQFDDVTGAISTITLTSLGQVPSGRIYAVSATTGAVLVSTTKVTSAALPLVTNVAPRNWVMLGGPGSWRIPWILNWAHE